MCASGKFTVAVRMISEPHASARSGAEDDEGTYIRSFHMIFIACMFHYAFAGTSGITCIPL